VEWEDTACLLCGGRDSPPLLEARDHGSLGRGLWFAVVQCQDCGLCYTNPRPTASTISQFSPVDDQPPRRSGPRRLSSRLARWRRTCPERYHLPIHGAGRLLDVCCGHGEFLARMHGQGWHVTGLDPHPPAVRRVRDDLGLPAFVGNLPAEGVREMRFDVITMWQALEYVPQPAAVLREAHRLLAPGGRLLVATPNIDSLPFRWFGQAWYPLDLPRRLTHFAPWTLQLMLERAGFRVGPVRMVRHSSWLRKSARLAGTLARGPYWHRWLLAKPAAGLATWYGYLTDQCDSMMVTATR
jgi:SAM-dependent methyltransferase